MIQAQKEIRRWKEKSILSIEMEEVDTNLNEDKIREFFDSILTDNDPEENYFEYGISTDWNGDVLCIDVEKFIEGLNNWKNSQLEEDEEDKSIFMQDATELISHLNKYLGYDLYFKEDKK